MANLGLHTGIANVTADGAGNLNVNIQAGGGGGGGSNVTIVGQTLTLQVEDAADGIIGSPVVADAIQIGYKDGSGNLQIPSSANPLPVAVISGGGSNASVGVTGAITPGSATLVGASDGTNLQGLLVESASQKNLRVAIFNAANELAINASGQIAISNFPATQPVSGTIAATQSGTWNVGLSAGSNLVGGVEIYDASGVNKLAVNASGQIAVSNFPATQPVSGTVAVTESGTWTVRVVGNTGAVLDFAGQNAAAPANALLIGGEFNTTPTTISSGNASPLQLDASGNLLVNVKAGSSGNAAAGPTGSAIPASADYQGINVGGTLRGATGVNPSGTVYAEQMDVTSVAGTTAVTAAAGVLKVGISGSTGVALDNSPGSAVPTNALYVGARNPSGILEGLQEDASNNLLVNVNVALPAGANTIGKVEILGSIGTALDGTSPGILDENIRQVGGSNVVTAAVGVQKVGIVGNAGGAMDFAGQNAAQPASALLIGGEFNTTPTTITTGNASPLQLDAAGNLLVNLKTPATLPVSIAAGGGSVINVRSTSSGANPADNQTSTNFFQNSASSGTVPLYVGDSVYGGAFSGAASAALQGWSKMRTPTVFKTVSVAATATGNTAVWTPGTGNKFRLLAFQITAQGLSATASAAATVSFQDSTTGMPVGTYDVDVPAVAGIVTGVSNISQGWVSLGAFGVLSAAANNVLNFNISAAGAGTTGTYRVTVAGTEE